MRQGRGILLCLWDPCLTRPARASRNRGSTPILSWVFRRRGLEEVRLPVDGAAATDDLKMKPPLDSLPSAFSPAPRPSPGPCLKIPAFPNHPALSLPRAKPQHPHRPRNGAYCPEVSTKMYVPLTSSAYRRSVNQPLQGDWHCTHIFEDNTQTYHYINKCVRVRSPSPAELTNAADRLEAELII